MTHHTAELGTNVELQQLVDQIRAFDPEYATSGENMALARALKIVATDIVHRHEKAVALQRKLEEHLSVAEVAAELSGVIDVIRPRKRGWFTRGR